MSRLVTCPRCGHPFHLADPGPPPGEEEARQQLQIQGLASDNLRLRAELEALRAVIAPPALLRAATAVCQALRTDELACRLGPLSDALRELDHVINPRPRLEPTRGAYADEIGTSPGNADESAVSSACSVVPIEMGRAREAP